MTQRFVPAGRLGRLRGLGLALGCAATITSGHAQPTPTPSSPPALASPALEPAQDARLQSRALTWGLLGGGATLLLAGAVVYGMGQADEAIIQDAARDERGVVVGLTQIEAVRLQDSAGRLKRAGALGLGLAGGLLLGGLVSWLLEPEAPAPCGPAPAPEPAVRPYGFAPLLAPGQAGLSLGLSF